MSLVKKLCESKKKSCLKKHLEGYKFCTKHILEDPKAPFIQCEYISIRSNKRCTNPIPLKYFQNNQNQTYTDSDGNELKYCVSHRHLLDANTKKRLLEDAHSSEEPSELTPSKKLQRVLEKQGIFKGKSYDLYKRLANNEIRFDDSFYQTFHPISSSSSSISNNNNTTTTTTTTTTSSNNENNNVNNNENNNNNNNNSTSNNENDYFNPVFLEEEVTGLYKSLENTENLELYESFNSDFYFSQGAILSEEEIIQRKKIYISKLILLYRKQYDRYIERLRILRRHYILSTEKDQQQQQQIEKQKDQLSEQELLKTTTTTTKQEETCCSTINQKCKCKPILFSKYCYAHILEDPNQKLFIGCNYLMAPDRKCNYPILKLLIPSLCKEHLDIYDTNVEVIKGLPKQQKLLLKQQLQKQQPNITTLPFAPIQK